MSAGKIQLAAIGAQDLYLTGNPQITYFKAVYRRHTNFAVSTEELTFNTNPSKEASNCSVTLSKNGDLISNIYIQAEFEQKAADAGGNSYINWTNNTGAAYIEECWIKIGQHEIDRHSSLWLDVYNELTDHTNSEYLGLNKHLAKNTYLKSNSNKLPKLLLNIPLKFWFNRNPGLALPIGALIHSDVKVHFKFRALKHLINKTPDGTAVDFEDLSGKVKCFVDYVHLSSDELKRFTQKPIEYLIETLQVLPDKLLEPTVKIEFSHPIKELIWVMNNTGRLEKDGTIVASTVDATKNISINNTDTSYKDGGQGNDYFNYQPGSTSSSSVDVKIAALGQYGGSNATEWFNLVSLKINGSERNIKRNPYYYRHIQPLQAHHKIPSKHIYLYSFALTPEDYSPSGTCNFTHVSSAELSFTDINGITGGDEATTNSKRITIFAVTYNILRISGGRGGVAYSN